MNFENFKNPPSKYRPIPFWSWNDKLDVEETVNQIREMYNAGIGGFFMHARGGLKTEYLSEEWFENVRASVEEAKKLQMQAWGYDENGWPSGFGSGAVTDLGVDFQQKYLCYEKTQKAVNESTTITNTVINGTNYHFYYEVNRFYVDTLDSKVTEEFLKSTHNVYKERLGDNFTDMCGFFTDEPQITRNRIPWSFVLEEEYKKAYDDTLTDKLISLFEDIGDYSSVRFNFWKLVRNLFAENFMKKIYDWCRNNNSKLTGHNVTEETFARHIKASGGCMATYEYMDIPGMDSLCRQYASIQTMMQLSSVAAQLNKKQIISETFALSGWNVSFEELRSMYEDQMCHGINLLCQHLEGYTLRGIRKRDYPASLFKHQPWWNEYKAFNDTVSRIGALLTEGEINYDVLVLHTIESGWVLLNSESEQLVDRYCDLMVETMSALEKSHIQYHLGDGRIMLRHGFVQDGRLHIGTQKYSVVVVPPSVCFDRNTYDLLREFKNQGGTLIFTEEIPNMINGIATDEFCKLAEESVVVNHNEVADKIPNTYKRITVSHAQSDRFPICACVRDYPENKETVYYLHNKYEMKSNLKIEINALCAEIYNPITGEVRPAVFENNETGIIISEEILERGSLIIIGYNEEKCDSADAIIKNSIPLNEELKGEWNIQSSDDNALTLEYCKLFIDGVPISEKIHINDVQEIVCSYKKRVKVDLIFEFECKENNFKKCSLVVETPEIFDIKINRKNISKEISGYYFDKAFKIINVRDCITEGLNTIQLSCDFIQSKETYDLLEGVTVFESQKNMLSYDMELEAIYLIGDFAVKTEKEFEELPRRALKTEGGFYLCDRVDKVCNGALAKQGYPFFAGKMTLTKKVVLSEDETENRYLKLSKLPSTVTEIEINGKKCDKIMWRPYEIDLEGLLQKGENEIKFTIIGNLRNLLGPFHSTEGEIYYVGPPQFFHNSPIWSNGLNGKWTDSYCFVEFGIFP